MFKEQTEQLQKCRAADIDPCGGLSKSQVDKHRGNPAGTGKADRASPLLKDNVTVNEDGSIDISVNYYGKGDRKRVREAVINIRKAYAKQDINISFSKVGSEAEAEVVIFAATLTDMVKACLARTCEAAIGIGGSGSFSGKQLLLNTVANGDNYLTDAHEFRHNLGLRHRTDGGIMDYPPISPNKRDNREVTISDRNRIRSLYGN